MLAQLSERDPALTIEVRLENSHSLLGAFNVGELDTVIVRQEVHHRDGKDLGPEHFGWFAAPGFHQQPCQPPRLAVLIPCSGVRDIATQALTSAGIEWSEDFVGGCHAANMAAVSAGLAVAAFSCRFAPVDAVEVGQRLGLPELPSSRIVLHSTLMTDARVKPCGR